MIEQNPVSPAPENIERLPRHGRFLMEANAGSGKTWQMATLYVWLIAHHGLTVEQVVVTTYTKSATEELRNRIVARLRETLQALMPIHDAPMDAERPTHNSLGLSDFAWQTLTQKVGQTVERLKNACHQWEGIRVGTLHGYFLQLLQTHALPSGGTLHNAIMDDTTQQALIQQAYATVWRQAALTPFLAEEAGCHHSPPALPAHLRHALAHDSPLSDAALWQQTFIHFFPDPEALSDPLSPLFAMPQVQIDHPAPIDAMTPDDLHLWQQRLATWHQTLIHEGRNFVDALDQANLNQNSYKRVQIEKKIRLLTQALTPERALIPPTATVEKECVSLFAKSLQEKRKAAAKKAPTAWQPPTLFLDIQTHLPQWWAWQRTLHRNTYATLVLAVASAAKQHYTALLAARASIPFSEVIAKVHRAFVLGDHAATLIEAEKRHTCAWLVDEFQDTDAEQWAILKALQQASRTQPEGLLVAVGDPKQAIYHFRGADLNAYVAARSEMSAPPLVLQTNHRATASVVEAVNAWFAPAWSTDEAESGASGAFLDPAIPYRPSRSGRGINAEDPLPDTDKPYVWVDLTNTGKQRKSLAIAHCIQTYQNLAANHRPFTAVVLVDTNSQGEQVAQAAGESGVRVQFASSRYAWEKVVTLAHRWLAALLQSDTQQALIALALTPFLPALSAKAWQASLAQSDADAALAGPLAWVREQQQRLREQGLWALWQWVWQVEGDAGQALSQRLQQAGLTTRDLNALRTLLLQMLQSSPEPEAQLAWLETVMQDKTPLTLTDGQSEPEQGVLEIATTHRAKGGQWDVVFCPFMDEVRSHSSTTALYFEGGQWRLAFRHDGEMNEHDQAIATQVACAERQEAIRRHYVMMTRAIHRTYAYFAPHHAQNAEQDAHPCAHLMRACSEAWANEQPYAAWQQVSVVLPTNPSTPDTAAPTPLIHDIPHFFTPPELPMHQWETFWELSFTRLIHGAAINIDAPDSTPLPRPEASDAPAPTTAADRYAGRELGIDVHALLAAVIERRAWSPRPISPIAQAQWIDALIHEKMSHRAADYQSLLRDWVTQTLTTPWAFLAAHPQEHEVPMPDEESCEWPFALSWSHGPAHESAATAWQALLRHLNLPPLLLPKTGILRGSLDWVVQADGRYWIIDFKTNRLPTRSPETFDRIIAEHGYALQAAIYQYALHRHLQQNLADYQPAQHLGGVAFLFLRAMQDPASASVEQALKRIPFAPEPLALMAAALVEHKAEDNHATD